MSDRSYLHRNTVVSTALHQSWTYVLDTQISSPSTPVHCHIEMNLCGSSCHSRGICSDGHCVCSNRTYIGDECELCRLTDSITVGCFHIGNDTQPPCMCYLSQSKTRRTPYFCTTLLNEHGETGTMRECVLAWLTLCFPEVPCDRLATAVKREACSRTLFAEPGCWETSHSLMFHVQTQTCLCRESSNRKTNCLNNGLMIVDDLQNTSTCS